MFHPINPRNEHVFDIDSVQYLPYQSRVDAHAEDNQDARKVHVSKSNQVDQHHNEQIPETPSLDDIVRSHIHKPMPPGLRTHIDKTRPCHVPKHNQLDALWARIPLSNNKLVHTADESRPGETQERLYFGCFPGIGHKKDMWNTGNSSTLSHEHWKRVWDSPRGGAPKLSKTNKRQTALTRLPLPPPSLRRKGLKVSYPTRQPKLKTEKFNFVIPRPPTPKLSNWPIETKHRVLTKQARQNLLRQPILRNGERVPVAKQQVLRRATANGFVDPQLRVPKMNKRDELFKPLDRNLLGTRLSGSSRSER